MAEQITTYQCPSCTGPMHFDGKIGKLKCDYCGSTFSVQEIEKLYEAKNASAVSAKEAADKKAEKEKEEQVSQQSASAGAAFSETAVSGTSTVGTNASGAEAGDTGASGDWGKEAAKMRAYNCTSCGAELICDETTAATQCPYCGNNTIIPGQFAGTQRPDCVIPFKYEKKDAVNALKGYYKGKTLLPGSFNNSNHLEEIKGVYVPFWLYSGHVDASGSYDAKQDEVCRQGEYEITKSKHYEVHRKGTVHFSRVPVDASTKMPDDLMDSIEPFDYNALTDFSLSYMPGYLANKYDVNSKECGRRAADRSRNSAEDALRGTVTGYTSVTTRTHQEKIYNEKTEYAVMPVWLLSTKWQGQNFLFAMNGQTGKMIGNLPISKAKQALWFFIVFIIGLVIFGSFMLGGEDVTATSYILAAVFALIPAAIVNMILVGQMKPVAQQTRASAYVTKNGVDLHVKEDRYIRTTESRVKLQNRQAPGGGKSPGGPHHGPGGGH